MASTILTAIQAFEDWSGFRVERCRVRVVEDAEVVQIFVLRIFRWYLTDGNPAFLANVV
jgi:hypothetical protein